MIRKLAYIFLIALALAACADKGAGGTYALNGAWVLEKMEYAYDQYEERYDVEDNTSLRIYDDSCYYQCRIMAAPSGKMITPYGWEQYTLVDRGQRNYLYLQGDNTQPLTVLDDSTIVIQETGCKYTWKLYNGFDDEKVEEIKNIIKFDQNDGNEAAHRYVFSYAERKLLTTTHVLSYVLVVILLGTLLFLNYVYRMYQKKKRVEQQLHLLEQEREAIPEPVRKAMSSVEEDFLQSDFYRSLRQKISRGEVLNRTDWKALDEQIQHVYPRFNSSLLTLCSMSQVELQVCQLLKLGCSPSEIASALCKETSSISSIRSRLFKKVFGQKGSSKDWDEFVRTL